MEIATTLPVEACFFRAVYVHPRIISNGYMNY